MKTTRGYSPQILKICGEIQALALSTPSDLADVFVSWSPHCSAFTVYVSTGGWLPMDSRVVPSFTVYLKNTIECGDLLCQTKEKVEKILAEFAALSLEERAAVKAARALELEALLGSEAAEAAKSAGVLA